MATHKPVDPDPKQIENAEKLWDGFSKLMKYSVVATVITLTILAIALVDF